MDKLNEKRGDLLKFIDTDRELSVIYHSDVDGVVSAALIAKSLKIIGKEISMLVPANYGEMDDIENKVNGKVIFLDMKVPREIYSRFINRGLCIIDHHEMLTEDIDRFLYINPKMWGDYKYTPNSFIVYKLFENELKDYDWLACIGLISDAGGKENQEFVKATAKRYDIKLGDDEFMFDNKLGKAGDIINSLIIYHQKTGAKEALNLLIDMKSLDDIYNNEFLSRVYKKVNNKIKMLLDKFETFSEIYDNIYFFELEREYGKYSSTIATILGLNEKYRGKIIVIVKDIDDENIRYSIRANGLDIDLNSIVKRILKNIPGEGGGHNKAIGLMIKKIDKERFKQAFIKEVKTQQP